MLDAATEAYRRYLDGETAQFDYIIEAYRENLIFYIQRYVHNLADAEDLAMDAFADLIIHPKRYRFGSSLKTYLFSIGAHKAIDFLRKRRREVTYDGDALARMSAEEETLAEHVIKNERARALLAAIDRLPEDYRNAVYLVYFEEMSYAEAGRVLGKSEKQINNLCYRAKGALRQHLEKGGFSHAES
ncbi:MAG: RNA polymerase sigma factor [Clostridia bacterium]|nr:RNA polymerase sigma factor [Clostridia bacterium]